MLMFFKRYPLVNDLWISFCTFVSNNLEPKEIKQSMNKIFAARNMFDVIIDMVVKDDNSPYNEMINKTKNIDIDYFEKIDRGVNVLSEELNPELKNIIVGTFSKMADSYYVEGNLELRIVTMIQKEADAIKEKDGTNACENFLNSLAEHLELYVKAPNLHPGFSKYTNKDVVALYQHAKHITITEFLMGNNSEDILDFYNALMDNTWWACREVVVNKTNAFVLGLAEKAREMIHTCSH